MLRPLDEVHAKEQVLAVLCGIHLDLVIGVYREHSPTKQSHTPNQGEKGPFLGGLQSKLVDQDENEHSSTDSQQINNVVVGPTCGFLEDGAEESGSEDAKKRITY